MDVTAKMGPSFSPEDLPVASSALSWPSSYRSSHLITPEQERLADAELPEFAPPMSNAETQTVINLPLIYDDDNSSMKKPVKKSSKLSTKSNESVGYSVDTGYVSGNDVKIELPPIKKHNGYLNRRHTNKRETKSVPKWYPVKPSKVSTNKWKLGNNELDSNTIYSSRQQKFYDKVSSKTSPILSPVEVSSRSSSHNKPDPCVVREKEIVMRNFFLTGQMQRFNQNKAVLPTVYKHVLDNSAKKRSYLSTMYSKQYAKERFQMKNSSGGDCTKRKVMPAKQCEFCDVMGNRYCSYCIEFKNRHFALGYESCFLPPLPALNVPRQKRSSPGYMAEILINPDDGLSGKTPTSHGYS